MKKLKEAIKGQTHVAKSSLWVLVMPFLFHPHSATLPSWLIYPCCVVYDFAKSIILAMKSFHNNCFCGEVGVALKKKKSLFYYIIIFMSLVSVPQKEQVM